MSVILVYLQSLNPSLVFLDNGNCLNSSTPAYLEKVSSPSLPTGESVGKGGEARGLEPEVGLPNSSHF